MQFKRKELCDSVVLNRFFSDYFKFNMLSVDFLVPLDKTYCSYISLISGVASRGNKKYGEMDAINQLLDKCYGARLGIYNGRHGEMQSLSFKLRYIDDAWAIDGESVSNTVVDILYNSIFEPIIKDNAFDSDFVDEERSNVIDKIDALFNDKRSYALYRCREIMFDNEKYGISELGDKAVLAGITPKALFDYYNSLLDSARVVISYVGKECDLDNLISPITKRLGGGTRIQTATQIVNHVNKPKVVKEEFDVSQSKLNLGFRAGQAALDDLYATKLFNVIYGASPTSKLFMNVREKMSLCYYCASVYDSLKNIIFVYSGIETEDYDKAYSEILNQLEAVKQGDFTDEEFYNAKTYLIDSLVSAKDSKEALASVMLVGELAGGNDTIDQQIEKINEVTPERVVAVSKGVILDTVYFLTNQAKD